MPANLFRVEATSVFCLLLAIFLGSYVLQRLYFTWKTATVREVQTTPFRIIPEWVCLAATISLLAIFAQGWSLVSQLDNHLAGGDRQVIQELEISATGSRYTTILRYPPSIGNVESHDYIGSPVEGSGQSIFVVAEVVEFSPLLRWLGQEDCVKVLQVDTEQKAYDAQTESLSLLESVFLKSRHVQSAHVEGPFTSNTIFELREDDGGIVLSIQNPQVE